MINFLGVEGKPTACLMEDTMETCSEEWFVVDLWVWETFWLRLEMGLVVLIWLKL